MNSIFLRGVLALVLMIGFYLLALTIAGGLLALPIAEIFYSNRIHPKLLLLCVVGALSILWAIFPRFDNFEAPGPLLTPKDQPKLFRELEYIAQQSGQPMPHEVYLVPDVNAWVSHRGGIMGFGSRPVMGLGLGLLQTLTVDELRAVLAHEFGHYSGSDTKLGPWVYKTRSAIGRTLGSLGDSFLQWPFMLYGKMFLRVTGLVSRHQEFLADKVAARVAGAKHVESSLTKTHGAGMLFEVYFNKEVGPILGAGFLPPIAAGFAGFMQSSTIKTIAEKVIEAELKEGKCEPYDSHPPLAERIAALRGLPRGSDSKPEPAIGLLENVAKLEQELLVTATRVGVGARKLKAIGWGETLEHVYAPMWRKTVGKNAAALSGKLPSQIPALLADANFCRSLKLEDNSRPTQSDARDFAASVLGAALGLLLVRQGWSAISLPGDNIYFERDGRTFKMFSEMQTLVDRKKSEAGDWGAVLAGMGVGEESLGVAG